MSQELTPTPTGRPKSEMVSINSKERLLAAFWAIEAKNITDVLDLENRHENTIASLARQFGKNKLRSTLVLCMSDMLRFFNLTQGTMSAEQVAQTIMIIEEDYHYLTFADFKVFFGKIKRGEYGTVYNRLDGQLILEWMAIYANERFALAETNSVREANTLKGRDVYDSSSRIRGIINSILEKP